MCFIISAEEQRSLQHLQNNIVNQGGTDDTADFTILKR